MLREDLRNFEFIEKMCPMGKRWMSLGVIVVLLGLLTTASGQMQVERIDRGAVAVVKEGGCFLSWRLLGDEPYDLGFNIYRDGKKVNAAPLVDATSFWDAGAKADSKYRLYTLMHGS